MEWNKKDIDAAFNSPSAKEFKDVMDALRDECTEITKQSFIRQIIEIYNNQYRDYDNYISCMQILIQTIRNYNFKVSMKKNTKMYVEPPIISEEDFNYIRELRRNEDIQNDIR